MLNVLDPMQTVAAFQPNGTSTSARAGHIMTLGCVSGTFKVEPGLDADFRQGFADGSKDEYNILGRFSEMSAFVPNKLSFSFKMFNVSDSYDIQKELNAPCYRNLYYHDGDIDTHIDDVTSAEDCQTLCQASKDCGIFSYSISQKRCWKKCHVGVNCGSGVNFPTRAPIFSADTISGPDWCAGAGVQDFLANPTIDQWEDGDTPEVLYKNAQQNVFFMNDVNAFKDFFVGLFPSSLTQTNVSEDYGKRAVESTLVLRSADGRCKGAPFDGWGKLAKVEDVDECKQACLASTDCQFMVYRSSNKACTAFTSCSNDFVQIGSSFETWEKVDKADMLSTDISDAYFFDTPGAIPIQWGAKRAMRFWFNGPALSATNPSLSAEKVQGATQAYMNQNNGLLTVQMYGQLQGCDDSIEDLSAPWSSTQIAKIGEIQFTKNVPLEKCDRLGFSPWHHHPAHKPLSSINRARKPIYERAQMRSNRLMVPDGVR
jgi:hypothetical protein